LRLQLVAEGNVLSYCGGWSVLKTKPFLFHMKHKGWKRFFWKVNTFRQLAYRVRGGQFSHPGGRKEALDVRVEVVGKPKHPRRFYLRFSDAYMVIEPGRKPSRLRLLQVVAQGDVLSYGVNWRIKRLKPCLFHLKREGWKGFYWKINTSRREVYRVEGGRFGRLGGREELLNIRVDVVY